VVLADPAVGFGGNGAGLLVVVGDVGEVGVLPERVDQMHGAAAGQQEDVPDASAGDGAHDVVGDANGKAHGVYIQYVRSVLRLVLLMIEASV
jgi:hypothetical protein